MDIETNQFAPTQEEIATIATRKLFRSKRWVFVAVIIFAAVAFLALGPANSLPITLPAILLILLAAIYYPYYAKRYAATPSNKGFYVLRIARITDKSVSMNTVEGESGVFNWSSVVEIRDFNDYILAYLAKVIFNFFPKRAFK